MASEHGLMKVKALLTILISETVEFFSVGKRMGDVQIAHTIDLILEDFSVYKPDYFILCFNRAKKGKYGKQYDRIDGQIIFEWLNQFDYEYTIELEHEREMEKRRLESIKPVALPDDQNSDDPNRPVPMPDEVKAIIREITIKKILPVKQIERTPEQKICDGYIADFDQAVKQNDNLSGGKRYLSIFGTPGRTVDITEYLELRLTGFDMVPEFYKRK